MMRIKLKKAAALVVTGAMMVCSLGACGSSGTGGSGQGSSAKDSAKTEEAASGKQYVIGIAEAQSNDEVTTRRNYLEKYIGPHYNVKFIFSEQCSDDAATKAFIENCVDSGADAIIDFKSMSGQMAQICKDNGMIYTANGTPQGSPTLWTDEYDNFSGFVGADNKQVASLFAEWLNKEASEDGKEGFLVSTSLASSGNTQHTEITQAILEGLRDKYGLTYEKNIDELVATANTMDAANDKGILITLYPGSPNKETWLPGVSSLIQSGNYGVFMSAGQTYNQSATVVNEVERSFGKNIKVASVGALGNTLTTAFNTKDPMGNSSVDLVTVKSASILSASLFAITYNALCGKAEQCSRDADGMPYNFRSGMIGITSAEQLADMEGWDDKDAQNWIANTNVVDSILVSKTPDLTGDQIQEFLSSLNYETLVEMMKE